MFEFDVPYAHGSNDDEWLVNVLPLEIIVISFDDFDKDRQGEGSSIDNKQSGSNCHGHVRSSIVVIFFFKAEF